MCGLVGVVSYDLAYSQADYQRLLEGVSHRGPDSQGSFLSESGEIYLGHTRLSILDLSANADQPFSSADGRFVMIYNGEVYNYKELANKHALPLKTSSDTEVLIELFARYGPSMLSELNGMFSAIIYDKISGSLFICRDRLGIKPLYYAHLPDGGFAFSSELPALTSLLGEDQINIDQRSLEIYLHRGYIPEPRTFYRNINKFPSGAYATLVNRELKIQHYWRAEDQILEHTQNDEVKVLREVHELLRDSIKLRLVADVPFGTFLSGGADSGLVTAIAAEVHNRPLNTFNVSFEDNPFDERPFAQAMAEHISANYHHIHITKKDVLDHFKQGLSLVGEPFADSSIFPTMAVSKFASRSVKMTLSGDGGDELFLGYGAYAWAERMANPYLWTARRLIASLLRTKGNNRAKRAAKVFAAPNKISLAAHIFSQEQNLFSAKEIEQLTGNLFNDAYHITSFSRKLSPSEQQAFFDITNYLKDDLLVKVDRGSMLYGLEVRVPFLDHRMVEFALNIDPKLKNKGGEPKYLLKKIMEGYYPKQLIYRKKWGFSLPLQKWLSETDFLDFHEEGLFNSAYRSIHKDWQKSESNSFLYNRLYALMVLNEF